MQYQVQVDKNSSQKDEQDFSETLSKICETNNPAIQVNIQKDALISRFRNEKYRGRIG